MSKKDKIFIVLASTSIIISFFLWYLYSLVQYQEKILWDNKVYHYVDISTSQSSIDIKNPSSQVIFRLDWELFQSGSIDLN